MALMENERAYIFAVARKNWEKNLKQEEKNEETEMNERNVAGERRNHGLDCRQQRAKTFHCDRKKSSESLA